MKKLLAILSSFTLASSITPMVVSCSWFFNGISGNNFLNNRDINSSSNNNNTHKNNPRFNDNSTETKNLNSSLLVSLESNNFEVKPFNNSWEETSRIYQKEVTELISELTNWEIELFKDKDLSLDEIRSLYNEFIYPSKIQIQWWKFIVKQAEYELNKTQINLRNLVIQLKRTIDYIDNQKHLDSDNNDESADSIKTLNNLKTFLTNQLENFKKQLSNEKLEIETLYDPNDETICTQIGYFTNHKGEIQIEPFKPTTKKVPKDLPKEITSLKAAFADNKNITIDGIESWDTSNITNMSELFTKTILFNQDISNWNTSNVDDMSFMFEDSNSFNQDISNWDISNVKNMNYMFANAKNFNQEISTKKIGDEPNQYIGWNTSFVKNMNEMFSGATSFNQDISNWNVLNIENSNNFSSSDSKWKPEYRPKFNK
ncbi:BspA family leucine-rich repeat surface protein [Mycoplasma leachii]|uniref:BspA family leucine-rich repeat surface protein n=1 Tax=Mycoplasma leachii TaxID=2105 RepID=UPI003DA60B15